LGYNSLKCFLPAVQFGHMVYCGTAKVCVVVAGTASSVNSIFGVQADKGVIKVSLSLCMYCS